MNPTYNLTAIASELDVDCDHLITQKQGYTHLLLRLGEQQSYPAESHKQAVEHILVLQGHCDITVSGTDYHLTDGEMIVVEAGVAHQFLSTSECLLSVHFVSEAGA